MYAIVLVGLGIDAAFLADFSLFILWGIGVRHTWVGTLLTGVALAGIGQLWHLLLSLFTGLLRKYNDQAETTENSQEPRRVA